MKEGGRNAIFGLVRALVGPPSVLIQGAILKPLHSSMVGVWHSY